MKSNQNDYYCYYVCLYLVNYYHCLFTLVYNSPIGNVTTIHAAVKKVSSRVAIIKFDAMSYEDERSLLGYTLYSMPVPEGEVSLFEGRDACGGDGWKPDDITDFGNGTEKEINAILSLLTPYTRYAFYIKTYTIASEPRGGQSEIHYFRTKASQPEAVPKLDLSANGSTEIVSF